jgi:hypothetical protein
MDTAKEAASPFVPSTITQVMSPAAPETAWGNSKLCHGTYQGGFYGGQAHSTGLVFPPHLLQSHSRALTLVPTLLALLRGPRCLFAAPSQASTSHCVSAMALVTSSLVSIKCVPQWTVISLRTEGMAEFPGRPQH